MYSPQLAITIEPSPIEQLSVSALEQWLWDAACVIRGATDAPRFKDFILPLVFYKRLSDVFDDELAALKQSADRDTTKVLNLRKALAVVVETEAASKPFVMGIGERVESLIEAYEDRQLTTQQVLEAFEKLAGEYVQSDAERQNLGVDENAYAIYAVLRPLVSGVTAQQAQEINALFAQFPDYAWDVEQGRRLRAALYKVLRPLVGSQMTDVTSTLLRLQRV